MSEENREIAEDLTEEEYLNTETISVDFDFSDSNILLNIPDGWEMKKIKDIGKVTSGTTPLRSNKTYHTDGNIPWVKTTDLNNSLIISTEEKVTELALKETSLRIYPKNTVLVAMYGGFNQIGRTGILGIDAAINQALSAITVDAEETDPTFLLNWFNAKIGWWKNFAGSSRKDPNITSKNVGDFPFLKIPLPEQKAIAKVLSLMDSTINQNNELIAQKELRKKWLMQNLLTGKKRLKGFGGEWKVVQLNEIFNPIKKVNDGGENHSIMTISAKLGLISQKDKFDRVIAGDSLKKYTQLSKDDFAYNKGNSKTYQMGCVYQLENDKTALVPFVYICFSPTKLVDSKFYKHWFSAHGLDRQLQKIITSGARGDGLLNVANEDFFKLKIIYPPKEEQTAIAQVLQAADKEIQLLKAKTEKLREQKKGMMQLLLTGKKRLKI